MTSAKNFIYFIFVFGFREQKINKIKYHKSPFVTFLRGASIIAVLLSRCPNSFLSSHNNHNRNKSWYTHTHTRTHKTQETNNNERTIKYLNNETLFIGRIIYNIHYTMMYHFCQFQIVLPTHQCKSESTCSSYAKDKKNIFK